MATFRGKSRRQPYPRWPLLILGSMLIVGLALVAIGLTKAPNHPAPPENFGYSDRDVLLYLEALSHIQNRALFLPASATREQIIQDSMRAYLQSQDSSSDYLSAEEYTSFKAAQDQHYVGIGMEIVRNRNGEVIAFPYPDSAAEKAGVTSGDRITHIDAIALAGKSMFSIASLARGKAGTRVRLTVQSQSGVARELSITRSDTIFANVSRQSYESTPYIKITSFTRSTKEDLVNALKRRDPSSSIVIDLRGNAGGDLNAAIDCAMLFLQPGRNIVTVQSRRGPEAYTSSNVSADVASPLYLWQDQQTASASEVFIAALTENGRAVSIGQHSFGKGTKQDIIELTDGSALVLTTGYLLTPKGLDFRDKGLAPEHLLPDSQPNTSQYIAKLRELQSKSGKDRPAPKSAAFGSAALRSVSSDPLFSEALRPWAVASWEGWTQASEATRKAPR